MKNDIVEELLSDLIAKCEGHMTSPFKKKTETVTAVIAPETDGHDEPSDVTEETDEKPEEGNDEMDSETMQKLIEAYKKSR